MYTRPWSEEEKARLKEHYPHISASDLARAFDGRSPRSMYDQARQLGLRKSLDRLREMGRINVSKRADRQRPA